MAWIFSNVPQLQNRWASPYIPLRQAMSGAISELLRKYHPPEAEPNVKLSHPERSNERLGKVFAGRGIGWPRLASDRLGVGCSALFVGNGD